MSIENMLLMTLEYIREYRTYFHINQSYGVSESTAYKTVRWIEDTLIKHPNFALPGRKILLNSNFYIEAERAAERARHNQHMADEAASRARSSATNAHISDMGAQFAQSTTVGK